MRGDSNGISYTVSLRMMEWAVLVKRMRSGISSACGRWGSPTNPTAASSSSSSNRYATTLRMETSLPFPVRYCYGWSTVTAASWRQFILRVGLAQSSSEESSSDDDDDPSAHVSPSDFQFRDPKAWDRRFESQASSTVKMKDEWYVGGECPALLEYLGRRVVPVSPACFSKS